MKAVFFFLQFCLCFALANIGLSAEPKQEVTIEQATLLKAVEVAEPSDALKILNTYKGKTHALISLALGHTHWKLASSEIDEAAIQSHRDAAEAAYKLTLEQDPKMRQAHLGLAQCAAAKSDWHTASREAALGVDPLLGERNEVVFLAQAALRAEDWRLAALVSERGIIRFPDDDNLRRIELAVLQHADRGEEARSAALALLRNHPDDVALWKQVAWSAQRTQRDDEALAALEAIVMLAPADRDARRVLAQTQLARGLPQVAVVHFAALIGTPPDKTITADESIMLGASRAAADAGDLARARAWLKLIPDEKRTRTARLQQARFALQAGDQADAAQVLDTVIALGEDDPTVLAWAGSLAESRGNTARAEALYLSASRSESAASAAATLRLVALYLRQNRREEARTMLATYLTRKPDDTQARALQAQLERAK